MSSAGTLATVLVCVPAGTVGSFVVSGACGVDSGGVALSVQPVRTYLIDPGSQSYFDAVVQPIDVTQAAGFWWLAFGAVVGLFVLSRFIGAVLGFVKQA